MPAALSCGACVWSAAVGHVDSCDEAECSTFDMSECLRRNVFDARMIEKVASKCVRRQLNAQELGIPLRLFLIKLMLAEMTEKKNE